MKYATDKQGRSIRELALLHEFILKSYEGLSHKARREYAEMLYERMKKGRGDESARLDQPANGR